MTEYVPKRDGAGQKPLEGKKRGMVGFALTILQRRLASSPNAIAHHCVAVREKLQDRLDKLRNPAAQKKGPRSWETTTSGRGWTRNDGSGAGANRGGAGR